MWDFEYLDRFPSTPGMGAAQRRDWKIRFGNIAKHHAYDVSDVSVEVTGASETHAIDGIRRGSRTIPETEPPLLFVNVNTSYTTRSDGKRRTARHTYLVRRTPAGPRILRWYDRYW